MFKTHTSLLICTTFLATASNFSFADSTHVYCVNSQDKEDWHWQVDSQGSYVEVNGKWKDEVIIAFSDSEVHLIGTSLFSTNQTELKKLSCEPGYLAQPASSLTSGWYLFEASNEKEQACMLKGFSTPMSIHHLTVGNRLPLSEVTLLKFGTEKGESSVVLSGTKTGEYSVKLPYHKPCS